MRRAFTARSFKVAAANLALLLALTVAQDCEAASGRGADRAPVRLPDQLAHIRYLGGAGRSCEEAVVIQNAVNTPEGIAAERAWIEAVRPGAKIGTAALLREEEKVYDVIELETSDGPQSICFDITSFFGSW